jgi:GNAT superfamily N-acetyltransferase
MSAAPAIEIEQLAADAGADEKTMVHLADLVNRVYAVAEDGLWSPGATRTNAEELSRFTQAGEIVVARLDGELVGSIRVRQLDAATAETGMLVSAPEHRNLGIGTQLRAYAVDLLRRRGTTTIQIELLVPRNHTQESKQFMAAWNERDGYKVVRQGTLEDDYPHLAPLLATPCDYIIYNKTL